jgi:hypothetical protein
MSNAKPGYEALFRGAARIGVMLGGLEIPFPRSTPFIQAFSEYINKTIELTIFGRRPALLISTDGGGKSFAHMATALMEFSEVPVEQLRRFLVRADRFHYESLIFGMEIEGEEGLAFQSTLRSRHELELALAMFAEGGADGEKVLLAREVARLLGKEEVHAFTSRVEASGALTDGLRFAQPEGEQGFLAMAAAAEAAGIPVEAREILAKHSEILSTASPFFTLLSGEESCSIALAAHDVPVASVMELAADLGLTKSFQERVEALLVNHETSSAGRVEVELRPDGGNALCVSCWERTQ